MAGRRKKTDDDYDNAAAGMDYDDPIRERAASLGAAFAEHGPQALFDEVENLLPDEWREQVRAFPLLAVILGVGVGVYLGMRKSEEVIAAGSALVSAAALANVGRFMNRDRDE